MASKRKTRKKRWLQFSLRTMLVMTAAIAAWLGWLTKQARDQRQAIDAIVRLGGQVAFDYQGDAKNGWHPEAEPPGPAWLRRWIGDEFFREVTFVGLNRTAVTDDDLRHLARFPKLTRLALDDTRITGTGLVHIQNATALDTLMLNHTDVDDRCLDYLHNLHELEYLGLMKTKVTGATFRNLRGMSRLEDLILQDAPVTDIGIPDIGQLTNLTMLNLSGTKVSDKGVPHLRHLTNLQVLYLGATSVTDAAVPHLSGLIRLVELELGRTQIGDAGLEALRQTMKNPSLEISVAHTNVSPLAYEEAQRATPNWRIGYDAFDLSVRPGQVSSNLGAAGWKQIMDKLPILESQNRGYRIVSFAGQPIEDQHVEVLTTLRRPQVIDLRNTDVTSDAIEKLRKVLPNCIIRY